MVSTSSRVALGCSAPSSAESIIEIIVRDTAGATGQCFFEELVRSLAISLDVRHCLLTDLLENGQLRTLAFWRDGEIAPNITYDPAPGPCGVVLSQDLYYCERGVQDVFPHQPALPLLEAESYVGVSLRSHQGKILGNLAVLDSHPILERKLHEGLLKLFAARASAELERQKAIDALQALNTDLEQRVENRTMALAKQTEELKHALGELQQTQSSLIQSEKMSALGRLVGGVAHEVNNPVSFIKGNLPHVASETQMLFKLVELYRKQCPAPSAEIKAVLDDVDIDYLAEDLPKLFSSMKFGVERIQQIVRSLRTFSRLDEVDFKVIDLQENLDSILLLLHDKLQTPEESETAFAGIQLTKHYGDIPFVECNPGPLNQVLMNLLYNAIEAIKERSVRTQADSVQAGCEYQGTISVTTELVETNQVAIRIADNGIGIPDGIKKDIFDPFFTTKPVGSGTGLGLSTSYQIITDTHGGSLECHSMPGEGAEFVVTIPLERR